MALCCDITLASEDAIFGEPELKFGAGIVVMILPWLVGPKHAKEIILRGMDRISAQEALRIGLINRVVSADELDAAATALARDIAVIDPQLVQQTKRAINRTFEIMGLVDALEAALEIDLAIEGAGSPDKIEFMKIARKDGLRAAIAWRDARFGKGGNGDNLGILLADACRKFAVQPALEETDNTLSYSQLSALSGEVASALRGQA